ncbi:MAG: substrate-binding domain-containing protein [Deltaproteobacteria bacterium]|nr:substrate-binding domain-containing protein [Deltaproteobacteria bacterium]
MPWSRRRESSFAGILKAKGFNVNIFNSQSSRMLNWDQEHPRIIEWLNTLPKPVAILCCNDDQGCDLVEACKTGGLKLPFEVAILGVDNDRLVCELSNSMLSSIPLSAHKAGFQAASILDKLMSGQPAGISEIEVTPLEIASRQSTDTLAIDDRQVTGVQFSTARQVGHFCSAVYILTGMGNDGTEGLRAIKEHGGYTIAEDESTAIVNGMPKSAIEAGVVDKVVPLPQIADEIVKAVKNRVRIGNEHIRV